jgi:hypothetical protein
MRMTFPDGYANAVVTWDSTVQVEGEWDYVGPIVSIVVTNTSPTKTVFATFRRGNGQAVVNRTLTPNTTQTYTGGGNIKNVEDIPNIAIYT